MTQAQQPEAQRAVELQVDEIIELACEWRSSWLDSNQSSDERGRLYEKFTSHLRTLLSGKCLLQIAEPAAEHIDDLAVGNLAYRMKAKLAKQRENGYGGWDTDCTQERLSELLRQHVDKGDPVDVANFCAFLLARGEGIAAAPQAVQPVAPQLKANCYSDDNGDYWRDCPDDCDFVEGLKVGDTYELQASIRAWSETFRVTKAPDETSDDYEVELVSSDAPAHPAEGVPAQAVQPSDALIEAVDAWFADNTGLGGCSDKDVAELAAIFATQPAAQGLEADMFWDSEDGERCGHDIESIIEDYSDGAILKIDCAKSLPSITIRVIQNAEGADYEIVDAALAAQAKQGGAA